jgi:hypothetical protein
MKFTLKNRKIRRGVTRKAPLLHASETELGSVMYVKGDPWIVESSGKSQRWNRATGYFTHDNGSRPFYVKIRDGKIIVLEGYCDDKCLNDIRGKTYGGIYNKHVVTIPSYQKVYIGENSGKYANKYSGKGKGNSILVHINGDKYIYIGDHVLEFRASDKIKEFHGIIGNNDVVYAFAIGEENTYLFADGDDYMSNKDLPKDEDPYITYFENKSLSKKIKGKIIAKRVM